MESSLITKERLIQVFKNPFFEIKDNELVIFNIIDGRQNPIFFFDYTNNRFSIFSNYISCIQNVANLSLTILYKINDNIYKCNINTANLHNPVHETLLIEEMNGQIICHRSYFIYKYEDYWRFKNIEKQLEIINKKLNKLKRKQYKISVDPSK